MCCHLSLSLSEGEKKYATIYSFWEIQLFAMYNSKQLLFEKTIAQVIPFFFCDMQSSHITLQPLIVNSNFQQITSHSQKNWLSRANLHEHRMASSIANSGQPNRNFYMRRETSQHRFWLLKNKVDEQWSLFVIDPQIAIKEIGKPWLLIAYCHK